MARPSQEESYFTTVPTVLAGEDACVLYVPEVKMRATMEGRAEGTALKDFMAGRVDKANAVQRGFGDYVLTKAGDLSGGLRAFWFSRVRSSEEIATAFRTMAGIRQGGYWPPVLQAITNVDLVEYDGAGEGYVSGTVWDFVWSRMAYRGPTRILEEYFASHVPFTIPAAAGMQDQGGVFDYGVGSMTLPPCLHGAQTVEFILAESSRYGGQTFAKTFAATTPIVWPENLVIEDGQVFDNGLYVRKRVTEFKPY